MHLFAWHDDFALEALGGGGGGMGAGKEQGLL